MKNVIGILIIGVLAGGVMADDAFISKEMQVAQTKVRQLELHGHEHAVAGKVPLGCSSKGVAI